MMSAPALAKATAMARPIPRAAPVTIADFPLRLKFVFGAVSLTLDSSPLTRRKPRVAAPTTAAAEVERIFRRVKVRAVCQLLALLVPLQIHQPYPLFALGGLDALNYPKATPTMERGASFWIAPVK
jgi:hypothetical protein